MTPAEVVDAPEEMEPYSASHIKGFRSAIVNFYDTLRFDDETDKQLNDILMGYEKLINELKQKGLMKPGEGKRDMKPRGYQLLAEKFMKKFPGSRPVAESWALGGFYGPI
jgi:hypothetical protein